MKTQHILLTSLFLSIVFFFSCQSDNNTNALATTKQVEPFHLNINLPATPVDSLLEPIKERPQINIFLKTTIDTSGANAFTLSINKKIISFEAFNDLFDSLRYSIDERKLALTVANLYIDKSTPYYLVDYLHKRLIAFGQHRISYSNKMGQHFLHIIAYDQPKLWSSKRLRNGIPPPPPPLPRRNSESNGPIFSTSYLDCLKRFGIDQKHLPHSGPELSETYTIRNENSLEIILDANNEISVDKKIVSLDEMLQAWQVFMSDESLWQKRIVFIAISGEADYQHYFETYSTILSAFQQKRNKLAIDTFGQHFNDLPTNQRREIAGKLPRVFAMELLD